VTDKPGARIGRRHVALLAPAAVLIVGLAAIAATRLPAGVQPTDPATGEQTGHRVPTFVEEALAAGLDHRYAGDFESVVGGGVAAFDCDDDGRQDLYLAGGSASAALFHNDSPTAGALRFTQLADATTDLEAVTGAYPLDVDGDATTDLLVLRRGENVVLRGLGDCRFDRANEAWGVDGGDDWTTAASATWEAGSGWPTIALGNYLEPGDDSRYECQANQLLRPAVAGPGFGPAVLLRPSWCTLSMLFSDWSRSGRRDLRVSNDRHYYTDASAGEEQLWRIDPGLTPAPYTAADGWQTVRVWGMGIAGHDVTGDGFPEYFLTSQGDNKLQTLAGGPDQPRYRDIALRRGVTATRPYAGDTSLPSTAWHAEFADVNNDSLADLFIAKGNVDADPEYAERDPSNLLLGQPDGTFVESAEEAGLLNYVPARGAALVDFNLDGLLDLVVVNRRENVKLWRNLGSGRGGQASPMGHWVAARVSQPNPNVDAVGAWVQVRAEGHVIEREITVGGGHAGGQLGWLHFGLGEAVRAEIRVIWPDGEEGPWLSIAADQFVTVDRGTKEARSWVPPASP
jgi:hypothetical protein